MFDLKKKILFKIWKFPQLSETFIVNQIVLAVKIGYEVKILAEEPTGISNNANTKLFEEYNLAEKIIVENYRIPKQRVERLFKATQLLINNVSLLSYLIAYYKESANKGLLPLYEFFFYKPYRYYDVIHIQFGTNKHPLDIMKKIGYLKSRLIVSFHGHDLYFPINNRIPNNGYYERLFEAADHLITNTPFLREKLLAINAPEEKITIIPVPVNTSIFYPNRVIDKNEKIRLVTVGRLDELKGQKYGIQAVNILLKKGYSIEYLIAGAGDNEGNLRNLINELAISRNVFLKGKISPGEVSQLLQSSDIFLMTSVINSEGMEESQGLVTAEAQACGLPVVAFDSGGIKYTLVDGKTGFLCNQKDIGAYAGKLEILINDEKLRIRMGERAVSFVEENYSENSVLHKWSQIYSGSL